MSKFVKVIAFLLFVCLITTSVNAKQNAWFNDESSINYERPDWMGQMSDTVSVSLISMPGTHETMANFDVFGAPWVQCNSLSLTKQLNAGIRVVDLRLRHIDNSLVLHHQQVYLDASFTDVLEACKAFLLDHPTEFILMKESETYNASNNSRTYDETLVSYLERYPDMIWQPQGSGYIPSLGDVRGKVVLYRSTHGIHGVSTQNVDEWETYYSRSSFDDKWDFIKGALNTANSGADTVIFNCGLNGNTPSAGDGIIITPWKVANGLYIIEWPPWESGWEDGMNERTYRFLKQKLNNNDLWRCGIIMMDYPGGSLIDVIIAHNGIGQLNSNDPPIAVAGGPYYGDEGCFVLLDGSGSVDFDNDTLRYHWCNEEHSSAMLINDWSFNPFDSVMFHDNFNTKYNLTVWDGNTFGFFNPLPSPNSTDEDATAIIITNVSPIVTIDNIESKINGCIIPGHDITMTGSFTDPGCYDTHSGTWVLDDGNQLVANIDEENDCPDATGTTSTSHSFSEAGFYDIVLEVIDDDSGKGQYTFPVKVRTPAEVCQFMDSVILSLDQSAFVKQWKQYQKTLSNKIHAVERAIVAGSVNGAINKLYNDLRKRWDGYVDGEINNDWMIDDEIQNLLCQTIDELKVYILDTSSHDENADINSPDNQLLPQIFRLSQNFPNPFNPTTEISFNIQEACAIRLEIFDVLGRQIETLVDKDLEAGSHSYFWDATNLSSGVYIYVLNVEDIRVSRKMVLLK